MEASVTSSCHLSSVRKVALIVGMTGIVGSSLAELLSHPEADGGPWKVYGVARRPPPSWMLDHHFHFLQCDILLADDTMATLSRLCDVTHLFYVTWASRASEHENCRDNVAMLQNVLRAVVGHARNLTHVCLQTGIKHYVGTHLAFDISCRYADVLYHEDMPRLPEPQFYYLQEDLLSNALRGTKTTWSVHRPSLIIGLSPRSLVNAALALAIYASICKHEGSPLVFMGSLATWTGHLESSDAELVAQQEIWAATNGISGAFNISNGDSVTWEELWPHIGQSFGIEAAHFSGQVLSFSETMRAKAHVWDEIVKQHGLTFPSLAEIEGGWNVLDITFQKLPGGRSCMDKSKHLGFALSRNTKDSLLYWFHKMREKNLIPKLV